MSYLKRACSCLLPVGFRARSVKVGDFSETLTFLIHDPVETRSDTFRVEEMFSFCSRWSRCIFGIELGSWFYISFLENNDTSSEFTTYGIDLVVTDSRSGCQDLPECSRLR